MRCIHCGAEWDSQSPFSKISFCPFCGKSLNGEPDKKQMQTLEEVLRYVRSQFGEEALRNGKQLMGILSDLLPERQRDRRLLGHLLSCGGQTVLLDSLKKSRSEQSVALTRVARKLCEEWFIRPDAACEVCSVFWTAMDGEPEALEAMKQAIKPRKSKENSNSSVKPAAAAGGVQSGPANKTEEGQKTVHTQNAPGDFRIAGNKLEKYTGADPVVRVPDGIAIIGREAFANSKTLRKVILPDSVVALEDSAFSFCKSLQKINFPAGLTSIGRSAFTFCGELRAVDLPRGLTKLGSNAFCECRALKEIVIPGGMSEIESWTFEQCAGLQKVVLESGVKTLGWRCFRKCTSLKVIVVPDTVTAIQNSSFAACSGISVQADTIWKIEHADLLRKIP